MAGLMSALSSMYEKPSASNKVHLMRRLFNLRMTEGASVAQHLNELNTITSQLSSVEIEFDDEVRALIILSSLPDNWNATVTTISSSSGNNKLKFDDVRDLVLSEEIRRRESNETSTSSALHTEYRGRTSERNSNRGRSKSRRGIFPLHLMPRNHGELCREWKITKGALVIAHGKKTGTFYVTSNLENIIVAADADGKSNLWHQRLCHMREKGMKSLLSKGKLSDLKNVDVGLCEDCIFGKQKKVSFAKIGKTPKAEKLVLVHTDVWGSSPVPTIVGSLYYVTFIDDSTRKAWVYFLKKKSEVFDNFRKWKAMVENETGLKVKRLRSDNGKEYRNRRFRDFCANNGIKMETTVPITPHYQHCSLPDQPWALSSFDYAERSKLDAKSNKRVFVGYGGDEFGYRFWDYENRKIIRSRDVIFNENVMYKDRETIESIQEEPDTPELRRSSRIPKPTQRYSPSLHYLLLTDNGEPECYDEAMQVEDLVKWESSMKDEMDSLMSNQTSKRYKARLVVKGFQQKEGIDYNEIFSPIVKLSTIRLVLKIVTAENLHLEQLDVKTAFLHGDLEEEIYMRQLEGFIEAGKKNLVCRLKKSLYGLKQAPRQWYKKFDSFMSSSGFTRCQVDHCCYIKRFDNSFIILLLYVDDMLVAGSNMQEIINLKQKLSKQIAMKDLGAAKQILGDEDQERHKSPKMEEERAHMVKVSYASAIGSLMYAMVCTRPDIAQAVGAVSRRSTTGYVYTLGGTAVSWVSQLQKIVALSTTEVEYVAVMEANKEMVRFHLLENDVYVITYAPCISNMWSFASKCIAGTVGLKNDSLKQTRASSECSDDESSSVVSRDEVLDCPICCESFNIVENVPYVLWCGHTLCKNCILGLQWAVLNGDRLKSHSSFAEDCQLDLSPNSNLPAGIQMTRTNHRRGPYLHHSEPSGSTNDRTYLVDYFDLERIHSTLRKSLGFFVHLTVEFPLIVMFLLIILYAVPTSAAILALYILNHSLCSPFTSYLVLCISEFRLACERDRHLRWWLFHVHTYIVPYLYSKTSASLIRRLFYFWDSLVRKRHRKFRDMEKSSSV
ncbi:hypothetical protein F3Y22_tig00110783pilonHSYRG00316 [Hibiscus syriacus]|uniref:Integrase catalytic domain-containing protein n=1 Tax=Hibiscus syriacus TaxID=106335 RepID=A0A6A2ZRS0_HIBSY|nr:hypothetical protein F3Y22_tig00110783pilonHSYRG00316 [Hibiscus syriacus]